MNNKKRHKSADPNTFCKDYTDVACQANLSRSKSHVRYKPGLSSLSHKRLGTKTKTITFYNNKTPIKVLRGQNLEKCGNNCSRYVGMDFSNGELLTVVTYMMNLKESSAQTSLQCHQMLLNIKQEFTKLQSLHHSNLCHYLSWKKIQCPDGLLIHVLMEYCGESSLLLQSNKCQMLPLETLRLYTLDLLKTIQYLHENNVAHRNINLSNVFIDKEGKIRLAGFDLDNKFEEVYTMAKSELVALQDQSENSVQLSFREDLFKLGLLVLSLVTGKSMTTNVPDIPDNLSPNLTDFLNQCLKKDEFPQLITEHLLKHKFIQEYASFVAVRELVHIIEPTDCTNARLEGTTIEKFWLNKATSSSSRFKTEYTELEHLGEGGFGSVYKVKNNLDGQMYAVKKVPINPHCKIDKKMMREVSLLSRLNHKSIVSYHDSWIETTEEALSLSTSSTEETNSKSDFIFQVENLVPDEENEPQEWKLAEDEQTQDTASKNSDNNADKINRKKSQEESSSDSVKFTEASNDCKDLAYPEIVPGKILFIKMECCDGRTLRDAIDEGLYSDMERVWRFFREIVEGLIHIHEKSIIHRDLKPVNIFLDYSDHVKIGDFGLARKSDLFKEATSSALFPRLMLTESSNDSKEGSLTQDVGTSYYVSPEVKTGSQYDEKADIYSLGIIFFEMCYRNFPTGQERAVVLTKLRLSSITLPDDFNNPEKTKEVTIIKHLLRHNPRERPTSREILNAYVSPLPLTVLLEEKVTDLLKCSFANPGSQTYKLFMEAFFNHDMTESQLLFFDNHLYKKMMTPQVSLLYQKLTTNLKKVFIKLGAKIIPLPLFMPKCDVYDDKHVVQLVNKKGGILTLPMDQRVPFARYVGQKQVRYLKRFAIEKVFRENCYTSGATIIFPPSECTECAFDIISPCDSLIPDAEILYAVQEIVNSLNVKMKMGKLKLDVQINHMSILKALLLHYGILEEDHNRVLTALSEEVLFRKAQFFEEFLKEYKITGELLINLLNDLKIKGSKREVKLRLKHLFDLSVAEVRKLAWKAWNDLKLIRSYADHLGFKLQITHFVGLILNPIMYSGIIFQVLDKTLWSHTIALGGRYDNLIEKCSIQGHTGDNKTGGVGISLQLEKLALILAQYEQNLKLCDVVLVIYNEDTSVIKKTLATCKILREIGYQMEIIKVQNNSSLIEEIFRHNICALPEFVLIDAAFPTVKVFSFSPREKCIELHIDKLIIHMRAKRSTRFEYVALM